MKLWIFRFLELAIMTFHLREKRLRDLNMRIIEAMHDNQLLSCMNALDELCRKFDSILLFPDAPEDNFVIF